jgi:hypothetical protein
MDRQIRELERAAASGDPDAVERLAVARERVRVRHPFLFTFTGCYVPDKWLWLSPQGNYGSGKVLGPLLPRNGVLRSVTYQVDQTPDYDYKIAVMLWPDEGTEVFSTARLKAGKKQCLMEPLKGEQVLPAMTPFGVRLERQAPKPSRIPSGLVFAMGQAQRSKFSAVQITLEFWM